MKRARIHHLQIRRVVHFGQDLVFLLLKIPFDSVAVVTHAGVIRCFWAHIAGIPLKDLFNIDVDYGDVFLVQMAGCKVG